MLPVVVRSPLLRRVVVPPVRVTEEPLSALVVPKLTVLCPET